MDKIKNSAESGAKRDAKRGAKRGAKRIVGIGEILWDEFPKGKKLGGAPANFAFHANALGQKGIIISRIGRDSSGEEIKTLLDKKEILYHLSQDPDHPTGRVTVTTDTLGTPDYTIHENSSWDFLSFDPAFTGIAQKADAVCFGTLALRSPKAFCTIKKFIRATRMNCLKIFDINLRQHYYSKDILLEMLNLATILKLNQEELLILSGMILKQKDETTCLAELKKRFNLDIIVLTKGEKGSRIFADFHRDSIYKGGPIEVKDSVGAGDAFTAVVATGLLHGISLDRINRTASRVASFVCTREGATPLIPEKYQHFL